MSWIHRDDLVDLIVEALKNRAYSGTYNATAPKPVRMSELCSALGGWWARASVQHSRRRFTGKRALTRLPPRPAAGGILGRPSWLPVPDFALQALLGEGATVVLEGQRVLPAKTQAAGFQYKFPDVERALRNILR